MFNLIEWLSDYVDVEAMNDDNITFDCPFCGRSERHFNVSVLSEKPVYNCYSCGTKGNWVKLISHLAGISYRESYNIISGFVNYVPKQEDNEEVKTIFPPNTGWTFDALEYLKARKVERYEAEMYGWYFCNRGSFRERIIFPIVFKGKKITFQARSINKKEELRYRTPYKSPIGNLLYGLDYIDTDKKVILVEGVFDWINLKRIGKNVLATFGKEITKNRIKTLKEIGVSQIEIMFDPDTISKSQDYFYDLGKHFNLSIIPLFDNDPGEMTERELDISGDIMLESLVEMEEYRLQNMRL